MSSEIAHGGKRDKPWPHTPHSISQSCGGSLCEPVYFKLKGRQMAGWWLLGGGRANLGHRRPCFDLDGGCTAQNSPGVDLGAPLLVSHSSQSKEGARSL